MMSETPKPNYDRGYKFKSGSWHRDETNSVYHSLKQEIQELSSQVNEQNNGLRLKKQISNKLDYQKLDLDGKKSNRRIDDIRGSKDSDTRNSFVNIKAKAGYKSVDRRKRKYDDNGNVKKVYEYRKSTSNILSSQDNKENDPHANNKVQKSGEAFSVFKEHYTTPPFKSYKSKIPEKMNDRAPTTSYRNRSKVYDESTRSSLNTNQFPSGMSNIYSTKHDYRDSFIGRR